MSELVPPAGWRQAAIAPDGGWGAGGEVATVVEVERGEEVEVVWAVVLDDSAVVSVVVVSPADVELEEAGTSVGGAGVVGVDGSVT
ncbi:MAG: hypothetical protein AAGD35_11075, partial [Actinomycetota bacterium]